MQSHVSAHTELMWFVSNLTPLSWLNRMIQYKEKKAVSDQKTSLALFSYPVLMAADIMCYKATVVPVGEDQRQHLELAKDVVERFNKMFGEVFPVPDSIQDAPSLGMYARVMSLQDASKKMSKSDKNRKACINLIDDPEVIRLKISRAKTDSFGKIKYDLMKRPEVSNLLRIYAALENIEPLKVDQLFENDNMFSFKQKLCTKLIDRICPIGEKATKMCIHEEGKILEVLDQGAKVAQGVAEETLRDMKKAVGILRKNI